jgi:hypothetical protein
MQMAKDFVGKSLYLHMGIEQANWGVMGSKARLPKYVYANEMFN